MLSFVIAGCSKDETTNSGKDNDAKVEKLADKDRPMASDMDLAGTPPLQPADHKDRWDGMKGTESCSPCHGEGGSAPTPPDTHFKDGKLAYQDCVNCHALTMTDKAMFEPGKELK